MTPVPYQDWQKYRTPGANAVFTATVPAGLPYSSPNVDVSTWTALVVLMENLDTSAYLDFSVGWISFDLTFGSANNSSFVVGPNQFAIVLVPVRDREFSLGIGQSSVPQTQGFQYSVYGLSYMPTRYDLYSFNDYLWEDASAYTAGQVKTFTLFQWYEGPASVTIFSNNNTAAYVEFQYYSFTDNNWHDFAATGITAAAQTVSRVVFFPRSACRIKVTNQGAAQTIALAVVPVSQQ